MINLAAFSRSYRACLLAKKNTVYFRAEGVPTRCMDTTNELGFTMSVSWTHKFIKRVAKEELAEAEEAARPRGEN
jgi:hypothetical protein